MCWGWNNDLLWNGAWTMALVKSLTGLRTLRLQVLGNLEKECWDFNREHFVRLSRYTEGLRKFSILPLQSVEIAIRVSCFMDGRLFGLPPEKNPEDLWQKGDRKKCAEELRNLLLDPNGAGIYANHQASQVSRRAELNKRAVDSGKRWLAIP
ncbi:MAG: hypothetical protein Q9205_006779 [Flavoplaca limonia]